MPVKIANRDCGHAVANCQEFSGSNLHAECRGGTYVVFSYGEHWPLLIKKDGVWYENADKYSSSTSRHLSQARRQLGQRDLLAVDDMKLLLR
jgi:hypothetical protein